MRRDGLGSGDVMLSIVHPADPWAQGVGGFDTCIDGVLRTAPEAWSVEVIGVSADPAERPVGRWLRLPLHGRELRFFAALADPEPDRIRSLPLSLRFAVACLSRRVRPTGRVVQYHRFEAAYAVPVGRSRHAVLFIHNHPEEIASPHSDVRWRHFPRIFVRLLRVAVRRAAAVVCVDPRTAAWVHAQVAAERVAVFTQRQWVDPATFGPGTPDKRRRARAELRYRLGLGDGPIVIYAGRLERQKNLNLLLDAFAASSSRRDDASLLLIGKGRLHDELAEHAHRLRLDGRFHVLPAVPRSDLAGIYRGCDVAACTSGFESGPRLVFEALASGVPVVTAAVGQGEAVVAADAVLGRVVHERTAAAFAEAIHAVLARPPSADDIRSRAASVADFTPGRALAPIFECYRTLAGTS
jgi:glycosyltransferase involved in cell wall biosynthesis